MRKISSLLLLLAVSAPSMVFGIKNNTAIPVNASGEQYLERYFLLDQTETFGIYPRDTIQGVATYKEYAELDIPLYVDVLSQNVFHISMIVNGTRYYAKAGDGTSSLDSNIENASTWSLGQGDVQGTVSITSNNPTKYLGFKNKVVSGTPIRAFGTTDTKSSDYNYNLVLLSVEDSVEDFVTAIKNIDCSTHNPSQSDWESAQSEYNNLPQPVKNYLKTLDSNKDAVNTTIEWALAKYDYIAGKYQSTKEYVTDYIDRNPSYPTDGKITYFSNMETTNVSIIVAVSSLLVVTTVTSFLFFKRRKEQ